VKAAELLVRALEREGAEFRASIQRNAESTGDTLVNPLVDTMAMAMSRKILHLDLDAFYPSVEVLDDSELAGKAVIVGGLGRRGVVASASYEARAVGVHSALPMAIARRRCPDGVYLRPRFSRYRELSGLVFGVYREWTDLVQPLSLDEAYLDVSERPESGVEIATIIRQQVLAQSGLTVSAGVASNKFLAKLASDHDKPDGLTMITDADAVDFLAPLDVDRIWGIGPSTAARLRDAGLFQIGDLAAADPEHLQGLLGKNGARIAELARGIDARPVSKPGRPKSISAETTFDRDIRTWRQAAPHVRNFAERISASLARRDLWARTVVLKVRFHDFRTVTRSLTPDDPMRSSEALRAVARQLARRVELPPGTGIRLIGLGVANLGRLDELPTCTMKQAQSLPLPQMRLFEPLD